MLKKLTAFNDRAEARSHTRRLLMPPVLSNGCEHSLDVRSVAQLGLGSKLPHGGSTVLSDGQGWRKCRKGREHFPAMTQKVCLRALGSVASLSILRLVGES